MLSLFEISSCVRVNGNVVANVLLTCTVSVRFDKGQKPNNTRGKRRRGVSPGWTALAHGRLATEDPALAGDT